MNQKHKNFMNCVRSRRGASRFPQTVGRHKEIGPQMRTDQPDHENPQRECITLDRTLCQGGAIQTDAALRQSIEPRKMAAATLSDGALLAILKAAPEIRVSFRVGNHHGSELGGKSQGGRRDRNQPCTKNPQRECITLDRTRQ